TPVPAFERDRHSRRNLDRETFDTPEGSGIEMDWSIGNRNRQQAAIGKNNGRKSARSYSVERRGGPPARQRHQNRPADGVHHPALAGPSTALGGRRSGYLPTEQGQGRVAGPDRLLPAR